MGVSENQVSVRFTSKAGEDIGGSCRHWPTPLIPFAGEASGPLWLKIMIPAQTYLTAAWNKRCLSCLGKSLAAET